ncbi:hypothetical protein FB45DRAFT_942981 [Roridomyces roridus]|uniref:CCHC-type domain-containing protein n=1 Tax=Roridomyces roridus TaxID=1738132 RepID=A0AAD7B4A1_9AGAR|nr:hypothetical protein FB45DRAFT_942981 [Roridomyces roridus]
MFSALRSIARLPLRTASTPVSPFFNSTIRCASSASAAPRKAKTPGFMICPNCRREGHTRRQCTEPVAPCVACGEVGHIRRKCPNPDQARLDALNTAPKKMLPVR